MKSTIIIAHEGEKTASPQKQKKGSESPKYREPERIKLPRKCPFCFHTHGSFYFHGQSEGFLRCGGCDAPFGSLKSFESLVKSMEGDRHAQ